ASQSVRETAASQTDEGRTDTDETHFWTTRRDRSAMPTEATQAEPESRSAPMWQGVERGAPDRREIQNRVAASTSSGRSPTPGPETSTGAPETATSSARRSASAARPSTTRWLV